MGFSIIYKPLLGHLFPWLGENYLVEVGATLHQAEGHEPPHGCWMHSRRTVSKAPSEYSAPGCVPGWDRGTPGDWTAPHMTDPEMRPGGLAEAPTPGGTESLVGWKKPTQLPKEDKPAAGSSLPKPAAVPSVFTRSCPLPAPSSSEAWWPGPVEPVDSNQAAVCSDVGLSQWEAWPHLPHSLHLPISSPPALDAGRPLGLLLGGWGWPPESWVLRA